MSSQAASSRKLIRSWHYPPPPPTPRILHLPRRPRRRSVKPPAGKPTSGEPPRRGMKGKLETLLDQERPMARTSVPIVVLDYNDETQSEETKRERVQERNRESDVLGFEEEKWRFQAEMLRAECNLLRMEKGIAIKKLHRTRAKMEATLKSALHTLVSGRIKICEGKDVDSVLKEEIQDLTEKLEKLQRRSGAKNSEARNIRNFDRQFSVLRRRLEKNGGSSDEMYVREIQEMAEASLSTTKCNRNDDHIVSSGKMNVEILGRKMEGLSKGMLLQRMEEEYNSILSTATNSLANSALPSKRLEFQDLPSAIKVSHQDRVGGEGNVCSGQCKAVVQRIVEQVRAETEQWSLMQEMLRQVRDEMEELQASRDFWEDRALGSDYQIQTLHNVVQEWKERALSSERKTNELEAKLSLLRRDLEMINKEQNKDAQKTKCSSISSDSQNELEKRILVCYSKENSHATNICKQNEESIIRDGERRAHGTRAKIFAPKRSPFQDIRNSSLLMRTNKRVLDERKLVTRWNTLMFYKGSAPYGIKELIGLCEYKRSTPLIQEHLLRVPWYPYSKHCRGILYDMDQLTKASRSSSPKFPEFRFCNVNDYISSFPPGFRFCPTDKELVKFYLEKKLKNQVLPPNQMVVADIYGSNPETLSKQYKNLGNKEWYFFSPRTRKYPKGNRPKRSAQDGYWKVSGTEKIVYEEGKLVARWNTLVFYEGSAPDGKKTNWIMREYRLVDSTHKRISVEDMTLDDYVLCRLYKKAENTNTNNDTDNDTNNDKMKAENTNTNNDTKKRMREIEDFVEQKKPKHDDDSSLLTSQDSHSHATNKYITTPTTFEDSSNCSLNYKTIPKEESYFHQQDHLACHNTDNSRRILEDFQLRGPTFYTMPRPYPKA